MCGKLGRCIKPLVPGPPPPEYSRRAAPLHGASAEACVGMLCSSAIYEACHAALEGCARHLGEGVVEGSISAVYDNWLLSRAEAPASGATSPQQTRNVWDQDLGGWAGRAGGGSFAAKTPVGITACGARRRRRCDNGIGTWRIETLSSCTSSSSSHPQYRSGGSRDFSRTTDCDAAAHGPLLSRLSNLASLLTFFPLPPPPPPSPTPTPARDSLRGTLQSSHITWCLYCCIIARFAPSGYASRLRQNITSVRSPTTCIPATRPSPQYRRHVGRSRYHCSCRRAVSKSWCHLGPDRVITADIHSADHRD